MNAKRAALHGVPEMFRLKIPELSSEKSCEAYPKRDAVVSASDQLATAGSFFQTTNYPRHLRLLHNMPCSI